LPYMLRVRTQQIRQSLHMHAPPPQHECRPAASHALPTVFPPSASPVPHSTMHLTQCISQTVLTPGLPVSPPLPPPSHPLPPHLPHPPQCAPRAPTRPPQAAYAAMQTSTAQVVTRSRTPPTLATQCPAAPASSPAARAHAPCPTAWHPRATPWPNPALLHSALPPPTHPSTTVWPAASSASLAWLRTHPQTFTSPPPPTSATPRGGCAVSTCAAAPTPLPPLDHARVLASPSPPGSLPCAHCSCICG
jgi:hypothetical protein